MGRFDKLLGNSGSSYSSSSRIDTGSRFSKLFDEDRTSGTLSTKPESTQTLSTQEEKPDKLSLGDKLYTLTTFYEVPKDMTPTVGYGKDGQSIYNIIGEGKDKYYTRYVDPYYGKTELSWVKKSDVDLNPSEKRKQQVIANNQKFNEEYSKNMKIWDTQLQENFNTESGLAKFNDMFGKYYRQALFGDPGPEIEMSTGSKAGDFLINLLATGAAMGFNPEGGAVGSLFGGFSKIGEKAASKAFKGGTKAGAATAEKAAATAGEKTFGTAAKQFATKAAKSSVKEGVTFAAMGAYEGAVGGEDLKGIAKTAVENAALGAGLGVVGTAVGEGFKGIKNALGKNKAVEHAKAVYAKKGPAASSSGEAAAASETVAKEPWQKTQAEYRQGDHQIKIKDKTVNATYVEKSEDMKQIILNSKIDYQHRLAVEKAIGEGKPVPKEVLAEYPELKAKVGSQGKKTKSVKSGNPETVPAVKTEADSASQEPWQMTKAEWRKAGDNGMGKKYISTATTKTQKLLNDGVDLRHKMIVEEAFMNNKPVPRNVAEEYPELVNKYKVDLDKLPAKTSEKAGSSENSGVRARSGNVESLVKKKFEEGNGTELVKRSDVEKFISDSLDVPVAKGKFRQKAYGIFKVKPKVIRLKQAKDLDTLYHETGHFLDDKLKLRNQGYDKELKKMGKATSKPSYSADEVKAEGVAEFMRHYLVDPAQAEKMAPKFFKYFESILEKDTRLNNMMKTLQKATENYIKQDPQNRLLSNVSVAGKWKLKEKVKEAAGKVNAEKLYTLTIDELKPLQRVVSAITGGIKILASENPFELAWLNRGWQGRAEAFLKFGRVDKSFNKVGKSFEEIIKPVSKEIDDFRAYAIAKRAKELANRKIETGISSKDIEAVLQRHAGKGYDDILNELVEYQDGVLHELVDQGIIGQEAYASMKAMNKDYIPFNRVMEQFEGPKGMGKGYQAHVPVKGIKGSTRDIVDPLESIIKNTYVIVNLAERNRVGKALVELGEKFEGVGKFFDKVPPKMMGQTIQLKDIEKALRDAGADTSTINLDQVANIFRPNRFVGKDNIITVFREGKPEYYEVFDESLYRSMLSLDRESTNVLLKLMAFPAKVLRAGATLTPEFMARNPLRDTLSAFIYSKYGFIPFVDTAKGLFHAIRKDDLYLKWISSGGANSMFVSLDRDYLQKNLRGILKRSMKDKALNIIKHPAEAFRAFSEFTEIATRLGEFRKGVIKEGMTEEGIRKAAIASRDITLDFARGGTLGKQANKIIAFFNASLQGTDKLIRTFKENPLKATTKSLAFITLPSVLLYFVNKDNPQYQEKLQWEKDTFWFIFIKKRNSDKYYEFRIPKPFELGIIFGTVPERILQWIDGNDPEAFKEMDTRLKETFVPDVIPTALLPLIEAWTNYSFYKGTSIVSQSEQKDQPWAQYNVYTSETAKLLGKALNQSPKIIENTLNGYGAGTAKYGIDITDVVLKATGLVKANKLPKATIEQFPLIKGFMSKAYQGSASIESFYDRLDELEGKYNAAKDAKTIFRDMSELKLMRTNSKKLSDIRKKINEVFVSDKYTSEKKKELIDKYTIEMVNIARKSLGKETIKKEQK